MERDFCVDTPLGTLHVYAKHSITDSPADYPGVYVDLVRNGCDPEMLACVEYDSGDETMLTTAYDIGRDEPVFAHHHDLSDDESEENGNAYAACIREAVSGLYVTETDKDGIKLGEKDQRLLFYDECDAENTLEWLNEEEDGCYVLLREDSKYAKREE